MKINIKYDPEVKMYVAHCVILNLYSQAPTIKQAKEAICEAIYLFITTAYENKVMEQCLGIKWEIKERGK